MCAPSVRFTGKPVRPLARGQGRFARTCRPRVPAAVGAPDDSVGLWVGPDRNRLALGRRFLLERPALAALYAQINHFNPSAHRIAPEDWQRALGRLNQPQSLTPVADLATLACPTLFVVGAEDTIVSPGAMHELATLVQGSEVVVIEHAAHSACFERLAEFNRHVLAFLQRCVAGLADRAYSPSR